MRRAGGARRAGGLRRATAASTAAAVLLACGDALAPPDDSGGTPPPAFIAPEFIFTADAGGRAQLYIFAGDSARPFVTGAGNYMEASSAAGRVAFSTDRDGNAEIYITDIAASRQRRVTDDPAADGEPALDPAGERVAFVRNRSGTPRIWVAPAPALDAGGAGGREIAEPLETGSGSLVPELSPAWNPDGARIAFVSARSGISQVYVVSAGGGEAVQWTHEAGGAFAPAWSDDGESIIYAAAGGAGVLRRVRADGVASDVASDSLGVGEPTCARGVCVAVTGAPGGGDGGGIVVVTQDGRRARVVFDRSARERDPAMGPGF